MKSNTPLDYAVFQLSAKGSRCELLISSNGNTEKLASGLVKPFVTHLKIVEEQVTQAANSVKLEVDRRRDGRSWFTKGTLERFVRFVSTPEILERVNTLDAEMSQLEGARKIYSQGPEDQPSGGSDVPGTSAGADATKKELLRAIDVRLTAVKQDLTTACSHASAAGFNPDSVSELQSFADCFGAHRLNEACTKYMSLCQRRTDLIIQWTSRVIELSVRASWESDMSIDDTNDEFSGSHDTRAHLPSFQQKQLKQQASQEHQLSDIQAQNQLNKESKIEEDKKEEDSPDVLPSQPSQPSRRLSVQDRISLFENKQKENSGGKPLVVGKSVELRRLSSDVSSASAAEKAVLRRWSGASDMSIDLGNDKKDPNNTDSPLCTPSSSSQAKSNTFTASSEDRRDEAGLNYNASSGKNVSGLNGQDELPAFDERGVGKEKELDLIGEETRIDPTTTQVHSKPSIGREEQDPIRDQSGREEKIKFREDRRGVNNQVHVERKSRISQDDPVSNLVAPSTRNKNYGGHVGNIEAGKKGDEPEMRDQGPSHSLKRGPYTHSRSFSGQLEGGFGITFKEAPNKETKGNQLGSQTQSRSVSREVEQVGRKESATSGKDEVNCVDSEVSVMKVHKPPSAGPERTRKQHYRAEESSSSYGSVKTGFPGKKVADSQESFNFVAATPVDQVQRVRQSKGNQELNDELKMKANELEKLFAEHKLRTPGDQSGSTRRKKPVDTQAEEMLSSQNISSVPLEMSPVQFHDKKMADAGDISSFSTPLGKMVDLSDYGSSLKQNFSELSFSDDSKGKFYGKYMLKRDAKLKEEWGTKRAEKEAKLKSMQDSLERSRAEIKAKLSGSAGRRNPATNARHRAEKLQSFNSRSGAKKEKLLDSFQSEEDEDSEFPEQKYDGQVRSSNDATLEDGTIRSSQSKKVLPVRNMPPSYVRSAAGPRSAAKISNSGSARRRGQPENVLAQSVPNFSDLRKENTKPSSGVSKAGNRLQARSFSRSKSSTEEASLAKEEKPRRSQPLRKTTASPDEFKDPLDTDEILAPLKFDKEQQEQDHSDRYSKNVESRPFLRKGNGIGPGIGAGIHKHKASLGAEMMLSTEESESSPVEEEDYVDVAKEDELLLDNMEVENTDMENGKSRLSQESEKMAMSGSENGDSMRSLSQMDPSSIADLPASMPSTFQALASHQDSSSESPVSWNLRMHHPFSYAHEISDLDAYIDSPIGSPASWNSHSLAPTDADAARMRKKWGSAQKPLLVSNSSNNHGRKDVTKGFKRLLKFGRKSRGTDLVDWISATTSEGDDDTEDGRDPASRSSDDLRKSRMGFVQGQPPDDGFNDSDLVSDHVQGLQSSIPEPPANFKLRDDLMSGSSIKAPRSFFSLSSFRSKGSDTKPR